MSGMETSTNITSDVGRPCMPCCSRLVNDELHAVRDPRKWPDNALLNRHTSITKRSRPHSTVGLHSLPTADPAMRSKHASLCFARVTSRASWSLVSSGRSPPWRELNNLPNPTTTAFTCWSVWHRVMTVSQQRTALCGSAPSDSKQIVTKRHGGLTNARCGSGTTVMTCSSVSRGAREHWRDRTRQ